MAARMQVALHSSCHCDLEKVWPSLRGPGFSALSQPAVAVPAKQRKRFSCPCAYLERPDPVYDVFNKVRGSLPIVGLLSRILSDDGGIGSDRLQFKEFCVRVYRNISIDTSQLFIDFESRHGSPARPQYVLLWCWAAAVGAGLLKGEEMMTCATRLRATYDLVYEEEYLSVLMDEAEKKRQKSNSKAPFVPYEARAEKALEAILKCGTGKMYIDEEDAVLLIDMLQGVFPGGDKEEIERCVRDKVGPGKEEQMEKLTKERTADAENERKELLLSEKRLQSLRMKEGMIRPVRPEG